jgi:hypothetical protein
MNALHKEKFFRHGSLKPIEQTALNKICGNVDQVMIYGFNHCLYLEFAEACERIFKKVFKYNGEEEERKTVEGDLIERISYSREIHQMTRECKMGLVNLIFENYKR